MMRGRNFSKELAASLITTMMETGTCCIATAFFFLEKEKRA